VHEQRKRYKKGKLSKERVDQLETMGFAWDQLDADWEKMFIALCEYRHKNGHCNVPQRYFENRALGIWVGIQRSTYKNEKKNILQKRIDRLDEIGFDWDPENTYWEEMFAALCKYRTKHGHCNVPQNYSENLALGTWVSTRRKAYKNTGLSKEQIERLEDIGFVWNLKNQCSNIINF